MDALTRLAEGPALAALFLDVDGVLAPIVEDPDTASVPETTRVQLRRLAERYALVACVTGRPAATAERIVGVPELTYVGEHGLELSAEARESSAAIHTFASEVGWHWLEVKPLSAAFHYRQAADRDAARLRLEEVATAALAAGFRTRWGRYVLEVIPAIDVSKGTAVRSLLESNGLARALYAGDDVTDLDGFAALDGLELAVRVAIVSTEGPSELGERADLRLGSPEAFAELLSQL